MNLLIVDGNCLAFNSYYKLKKWEFAKLPDGTIDIEKFAKEGALGFARILSWMIHQYKPRHLIVVVDKGGKNFRQELFDGYKTNRCPPSEEFIAMMDVTEALLIKSGVACTGTRGYEADDIIASIVKKTDVTTTIITGDKDLFQLVDEKVKVAYTADGMSNIKLLDEQEVKKSVGVMPKQIVEYKALAGDKRDNYGGLPGIGKGGAIEILSQFSTAEQAYENIEEVNKIYRTNFLRNKDKYERNKKLAQLIDNMDIDINIEDTIVKPEHKNLRRLFKKYLDTTQLKVLKSEE